jgi:hemolysin activation/secretion protein
VAISGTEKPGEVVLDYLVNEARPWYVYAQIANTGTKETSDWRERFGGIDNQLTGHDDILSIEYVTSGFSASHSVLGSYEFPLPGTPRVRNKLSATWSAFTASDVGQSLGKFKGDQWTVGDEFIVNVYQQRELFVDAIAGTRFQDVSVTNETYGTPETGRASYVVPYVGLRLDRTTDISTTQVDGTVSYAWTDAGNDQREKLGRFGVNQNYWLLQASGVQSFYLEPLLDPGMFQAGRGTLAHELYFSGRMQYSAGSRLIPQFEQVLGGLYTVRGYPESIAAGDSIFVGTAEYRFHLPRALAIQPDPSKTPVFGEPFRFSPQQPWARPDWDLILRAFLDVGRTFQVNRTEGEGDETLVGTGVGVELQLKQNINLRVDWGVALDRVTGQVDPGANRFHIVGTFLY